MLNQHSACSYSCCNCNEFLVSSINISNMHIRYINLSRYTVFNEFKLCYSSSRVNNRAQLHELLRCFRVLTTNGVVMLPRSSQHLPPPFGLAIS